MTLANYEFHKLRQRPLETFDSFVNRVKREANYCEFKCANANCMVRDVMIRDQVICGTTDNEIRKSALKNEWNLTDLQSNGRKLKAAAYGAAQIKNETEGTCS